MAFLVDPVPSCPKALFAPSPQSIFAGKGRKFVASQHSRCPLITFKGKGWKAYCLCQVGPGCCYQGAQNSAGFIHCQSMFAEVDTAKFLKAQAINCLQLPHQRGCLPRNWSCLLRNLCPAGHKYFPQTPTGVPSWVMAKEWLGPAVTFLHFLSSQRPHHRRLPGKAKLLKIVITKHPKRAVAIQHQTMILPQRGKAKHMLGRFKRPGIRSVQIPKLIVFCRIRPERRPGMLAARRLARRLTRRLARRLGKRVYRQN